MESHLWTVLIPSVLLIAVLYSSVGHGGASSYLAVLALAGFARSDITPVALVLNIVVASTSLFNYWQAGHFSSRLLAPFAVASIPATFVGGMITVGERIYAGLLGGTLLVAALRFLLLPRVVGPTWTLKTGPPWMFALPIGGLLGLLAGMVGVGGGIFLSPLLLLLGWADAKQTAAASAAFIVLNSLSGLSAHLLIKGTPLDWALLIPLVAAVWIGGFAGSLVGAGHLSSVRLQQLLGCVLAIAGLKLIDRAW
ncbi:MAG: sulfite exporter TauE/SafE family protein [Nitrospirae bacterium]|nr:sulfite exporter TauE/SafE family protein [Nitrospirota bacterium]